MKFVTEFYTPPLPILIAMQIKLKHSLRISPWIHHQPKTGWFKEVKFRFAESRPEFDSSETGPQPATNWSFAQ